MIRRNLEHSLKERLFKGKAILLYGPRQVGKTTLVKLLLLSSENSVLMLSGDDADNRALLKDATAPKIKSITGTKTILFLDEAQRFENIGLLIKIIVDQLPEIQVIATGSSAFELADRIKESMAGRVFEFQLFPISYTEMVNHHTAITERRLLTQRLLYGYYPEIIINQGDATGLLYSLVDSALYKDILTIEQIRKPVLIQKLLRALALQVGQEVSFNEIAQLIGSNRETVERYIDIFEKSFIIYTLPAFSGNVRNEIKRGRKIYFCDNGILNALIGDFRQLEFRSDVGSLWENFLIMERYKYLRYAKKRVQSFFWRSTQQQEVDYIEVENQTIYAWEFKWNPNKKTVFPVTFTKAYQPATTTLVNNEYFEGFVGMEGSDT
jgi:predicted AAA+ superfamily ATPase